MLSIALDQSNVVIAQSLTDNTMKLLKKGNHELAWDCYRDLKAQKIQQHITRDQYRILIRRFGNQKSSSLAFESVLTLVEDMKQLGYQVGRKERLLVMKLLGQNGMLKEMESMYEDLVKDDILIVQEIAETRKVFNVMLSAYEEQKIAKGSNFAAENIIRIYQTMLEYNIEPAPQATVMFLEGIRTAGYSNNMTELVLNFIRPKLVKSEQASLLDPTVYENIVYYFANAGHPAYALEVNDFMAENEMPRSVRTMTALMHKVGRSGDTEKATELMDELTSIEGYEPNIVTYNALIDIHAHKKPEADIEGANRAYDMLREAGLNPDVYTFSTLMNMFAKKGDLLMVQRLYRYMSRRKNIKPNEYTASSIVECFVKLGDMESALKMLKFVRSANMKTTVVFDLVFKGFINQGKILDAFTLLKSIDNDFSISTQTFVPLLTYYANRGDLKKVHEVASLLHQANVPATSAVYNALLKSHAKVRDTAGAERVFESFKKRWRRDISVYNALLYAYVNNDEMEKVFETYRNISKENVEPNEKTYGILMHFYSRRKEVLAVESIIERMKVNGIKPGIICKTILMQTYFEANRPLDAKSIMDEMLQAGLEPTPQTWGILVDGCAKTDQLDFAEAILQEAIERSKDSPIHQKNLLQNAAVKYVKNKGPYVEEVPETISDILEKANVNEVYKTTVLSAYLFTPLIDVYSNNRKYTRAKELFNKMVDLNVSITIPVYVTMMNMFKNESNYDAVETMWNALNSESKAQKYIENIDPEVSSIPVPERYYDYLHLLSINDDYNFNVEDPLNKDIIPEQSSYFALSVYIDSLIDQNRNDDVKILWEKLKKKNYKFDEQNWNRYIVSLLLNGDTEEACNIVSELFFDNEDTNTMQTERYVRKRDRLDVDSSNQIHDRTCFMFAQIFQIPGAENMGVLRLRTAVVEKIKKFMRDTKQ